MTVRLELPFKPFSVNRMNSRDMRFKSAEFRDWHLKVSTYILHSDEYKSLLELAQSHKDSKETKNFYVEITVNYPAYMFWNKQKQISSKTVDCSNFSKPLIDILFGDIMDVNDKYIVGLKEQKRAGSSQTLEITIMLV